MNESWIFLINLHQLLISLVLHGRFWVCSHGDQVGHTLKEKAHSQTIHKYVPYQEDFMKSSEAALAESEPEQQRQQLAWRLTKRLLGCFHLVHLRKWKKPKRQEWMKPQILCGTGWPACSVVKNSTSQQLIWLLDNFYGWSDFSVRNAWWLRKSFTFHFQTQSGQCYTSLQHQHKLRLNSWKWLVITSVICH